MTDTGIPARDGREAALYARLRELEIAWTAHAHEPVFTVEQAAKLYAQQPGGHTKNLFLKDKKGRLWLVVARDDLKIDLGALAKQLGCQRLSFGAPELLAETLNVTPGSVTPFALMNDTGLAVKLVLDAGMLQYELLNFHPLRNDRTIAVTSDDLLRFVRATGHDPLIATLPERPQ